MAVDLGGVFIEFKSNVNQFVKELRQVGFQLNVMESLAHSAEQKMRALMVTAQYGARASLAVWLDVAQAAGELDQAMADLSTVLDTNARGFQEISKAAMDWSNNHVTSLNDITKATYDMASAGLNQVQIMETMNRAATLSVATFGSMEEATRAMASAMLTFGKALGMSMSEAEKADSIMNSFAYTVQKFRIILPELESGLAKVTGVANTLGVSLEDMSVGIGILKTAGLSAEEAGTALKNVYERIGKAATDMGIEVYDSSGHIKSLADLIEIISSSFTEGTTEVDKYTKLLTVFGQRGVKAVSILSNYTTELQAHSVAIKNSSDAYDMAAKREEGFGAQMQILSNNLNNFKVVLGESLIPSIKLFSEFVADLSTGFQALNPAIAGFISQSGLVVTVLTLILTGFGLVAKSIGGLITTMKTFVAGFASLLHISMPLTGVLTLIGAAVGVLITSFIAWRGAQERLSKATKEFIDQQVQSSEQLRASSATLQSYIVNAGDVVEVTDQFKSALDNVLSKIPSYVVGIGLISEAYAGNVGALREILQISEDYQRKSLDEQQALAALELTSAEDTAAAIQAKIDKYEEAVEIIGKLFKIIDDGTGEFLNGPKEGLRELSELAKSFGVDVQNSWDNLTPSQVPTALNEIEQFFSKINTSSQRAWKRT